MGRHGKARREATNSSFQTGDLLRRGLSWYADHYGVYLGRHQGQEWVFEVTRIADQPERATIRTVPLQLFAEGKPCAVIEHGTADPAVIRGRVDELLGTAGLNYLLLGGDDGWNCESAARYIATGRRRTAQGEAIDKAARVGKGKPSGGGRRARRGPRRHGRHLPEASSQAAEHARVARRLLPKDRHGTAFRPRL